MNVTCPSCGKLIAENPSFNTDRSVSMVCTNCVANWERFSNDSEPMQDAQDGRVAARLVGGAGDGDDEPVEPFQRVRQL